MKPGKIIALFLAALLCLGLIMPAQADHTAADYYEDGLAYLKRLTPEYVEQSIAYFTSAGSYGQAAFLTNYAQALLDILTFDENSDSLDGAERRLERVGRNEDFAALLTEQGLPSCQELILYAQARQLEMEGEYRSAIAIYDQIEYVLDSLTRSIALDGDVMEKLYSEALALFDAGDYAGAMEGFRDLHYRDSNKKYQEALEKHEHVWQEADCERPKTCTVCGKTEGSALGHDWREADYYHPKTCARCGLTEGLALGHRIAAGWFHTVGIQADGTVVIVGKNLFGERNTTGWTDIVAVSAGPNHTVGLRSDGTVVVAGPKTGNWNGEGQCDTEDWMSIVAVAAGGWHTVGLRADGTVAAVGNNKFGQCDTEDWTGIITVAAGEYHTVGLRADGTVVAVGGNEDGRCDTAGWTDIVAVSAGDEYTVGLRADGTVVAVGLNHQGQCDIAGWTDIVAVAAGNDHTVGLQADGTVIAVGRNDHGMCDTDSWRDIVAVDAGANHTVGLRTDGTVVAVGGNLFGQCNVSGWNLN